MARNPLRPALSTADVIRELRLDQADLTPEARRAAARAAAQWMTAEQRRGIAERNSALYDESAHKVKITAYLMAHPEVR
jgi:antibiotic biosynthesis monooxygenase (ABM) superfamily enzyme